MACLAAQAHRRTLVSRTGNDDRDVSVGSAERRDNCSENYEWSHAVSGVKGRDLNGGRTRWQAKDHHFQCRGSTLKCVSYGKIKRPFLRA